MTRDGTAESVSRDQILRRERGQGNNNFPYSAYDLEQDWQRCQIDLYSAIISDDYAALQTCRQGNLCVEIFS